MENTIHPNDVQELDSNTFSYITLKNGELIMIDNTAPEKPKTGKRKSDTDTSKNGKKIPQELLVSEQLTFSFMGKGQDSNRNSNEKINGNNDNNKIIVKSDFNSLSKIIKNTNFSFFGNPQVKERNNEPLITISKNENELQTKENIYNNNEKKDNSNVLNSLYNNLSPNFNSNKNNKENINQNELFKGKNRNSVYSVINPTSSSIMNIKNELNLDEKNNINARIKRKSQIYTGRMEKFIDDITKPTIKAVISLFIPSDVNRELNATQKHFDKLVTQFRQKQNKYYENSKYSNSQKYYELYKNNNIKINEIFGPNFNRIKYYHEAEAEDDETNLNIKSTPNTKRSKNFSNTNSKNLYGGLKRNINKSINLTNISNDFNFSKTITSFNGNKTRALSEKKNFLNNNKIIGYSSHLIYPSNRFLHK